MKAMSNSLIRNEMKGHLEKILTLLMQMCDCVQWAETRGQFYFMKIVSL